MPSRDTNRLVFIFQSRHRSIVYISQKQRYMRNVCENNVKLDSVKILELSRNVTCALKALAFRKSKWNWLLSMRHRPSAKYFPLLKALPLTQSSHIVGTPFLTLFNFSLFLQSLITRLKLRLGLHAPRGLDREWTHCTNNLLLSVCLAFSLNSK